MLVNDRAEFASLMGRLCEVFDRKPSGELVDSYWQACQLMSLGGFRTATTRAIEKMERMPRPSQLWNFYRDQRTAQYRQTQAQTEETSARSYDDYHCFGQRCLLRFLMSRGGVDPAILPRIVEAKNKVVSDYRLIGTEDHVTADEMREALFAAFEKAAA